MSDDGIQQKLMEKLEAIAGEAREIYETAEKVKRLTGVEIYLPDIHSLICGGGETSPTIATSQELFSIQPDTFFRMDKLDAVQKYLENVKKPVLFSQICEALTKGGLDVRGESDKGQLNVSLTRSNRRFKKFGSGTEASFGLLSWYEERTEKKSRFTRGTSKSEVEKPEGEVEGQNGSSESQLSEGNKE